MPCELLASALLPKEPEVLGIEGTPTSAGLAGLSLAPAEDGLAGPTTGLYLAPVVGV